MVVDLKIYRENKEIIKNINEVNSFFINNFPQKSWGWVGVTALIYSQLAILNYLKTDKVQPEFKKILKAMLWEYQSEVTKTEVGKEDRHE